MYRCAVTNNSWDIEAAHLIPREEGDWFRQNGMSMYGDDSLDTEDSANLIRLRGDIHTCFDRRFFTLVPKPRFATSPETGYQYVIHVLAERATEFAAEFHNRAVRYLESTQPEYLFARFAWAVLLGVKPLVLQGSLKRVARFKVWEGSDTAERRVEELPGPVLTSSYGAGRTKSASPKKRKPEATDSFEEASSSEVEESPYDGCDWRNDKEIACNTARYENYHAPEWEERGRSRTTKAAPAG
jgi:hypothetical protein